MMKPREQCEKFIEEAKHLGFTEAISEGKLRNIIMNTRNVINERTITDWIHALLAFDYIELTSAHVYKIKNGSA